MTMYWRLRYAAAPSWMAAAIWIMRSLPGGLLRTYAVRMPAKTTATAPPPIARRTLESIYSPFLTVVLNGTAAYRGLGAGFTGGLESALSKASTSTLEMM